MAIDYHDHALADLEALWHHDELAAADIAAFLEAVADSADPIDAMTQHGNARAGGVRYHLTDWVLGTGRQRNQLWRARVLDSPATRYRIVYGYHIQSRQIVVLAVVRKDDFDYGTDSDLARRILVDWRAITG